MMTFAVLAPARLLAVLLAVGGLIPEADRPSPVPASDAPADIAAKVAELQAFFGGDEALLREAVATAQQGDLIERLQAPCRAPGRCLGRQ